MKIKTVYEVRFTIYQHNSGRGDNGSFIHKNHFETLEMAKVFYHRLQKMLKDKLNTYDFAITYVWCGYLEQVDGIYKITEEKILI